MEAKWCFSLFFFARHSCSERKIAHDTMWLPFHCFWFAARLRPRSVARLLSLECRRYGTNSLENSAPKARSSDVSCVSARFFRDGASFQCPDPDSKLKYEWLLKISSCELWEKLRQTSWALTRKLLEKASVKPIARKTSSKLRLKTKQKDLWEINKIDVRCFVFIFCFKYCFKSRSTLSSADAWNKFSALFLFNLNSFLIERETLF